MRIRHLLSSHFSQLAGFAVWAGVTMFAAPLSAEPTPLSQETFLRAKQVTVGILEDTQDQRTPEKPGKIVVRGTGFHLRDGYVITARHAAEKHDPSTGAIIQKHVRILTSDLNELPADLVGDSAFMDVVIYRIAEQHRSKLLAGTVFAAGDATPGMEVFTVGFPLGWGPTMAFGSRLRWEARTAWPDQAGIGCLEAPEGPADRALQVDVLVVRAPEREIGRHQIAIRHRHETENEAARIDLDDAAQPGYSGPQIALDVVMDPVRAPIPRAIGARFDTLEC